MSEEVLQIAEKRRHTKGKGERERCIQLNVEFQRRARRDKKAFLNEQCKEIEENNRVGKPRDLSRKLEIPREYFMQGWAQKDRNSKDPTEGEEIKKGWQEYTKELCIKGLHDPDIHSGVVTHLEPDILECEVEWALGSITMNKASGCDGTLAELFKATILQ